MSKKHRHDFLKASVRRLLGLIVTLLVIVGLSALVVHWSFPTVGEAISVLEEDATAVLFGSATVALMAVTILVGLLAFFGWQSIQEKVALEVDKALADRGLEKARNRIITGAVYGVLAEYFHFGYTPDYLCNRAIHWTRGAFEFADIEGEREEHIAKNNLASQLALRAALLGRGKTTVEDAQLAMDLMDRRAPWKFSEEERVEWVLTKSRVVAQFACLTEEDPLPLIDRAIDSVQRILDRTPPRDPERTEAEVVMADLETARVEADADRMKRRKEETEAGRRSPEGVMVLISKLVRALLEGRWR